LTALDCLKPRSKRSRALSKNARIIRCLADGEQMAEHRPNFRRKVMRYALLIYVQPWDSTPEQDTQVMEAYNAFGTEAVAADVMRGGEALHEAKTATSVRVRDGKVLVTDGPFAETKEEFGGFYLVEAPNLDEAIKWAAKIPGAVRGTVEIRPVVDFDAAVAAGESPAGIAAG
jgi:hypothetical protein